MHHNILQHLLIFSYYFYLLGNIYFHITLEFIQFVYLFFLIQFLHLVIHFDMQFKANFLSHFA